MGQDKALVHLAGKVLIERAMEVLAPYCSDLLIVARQPGLYEKFGGNRARLVRDILPGGALAGIHAAVKSCNETACIVTAVDMPLIRHGLIELLIRGLQRGDAVVPRHAGRFEPLCAAYSKACLPAIEKQLGSGEDFKIVHFYREITVVELVEQDVRAVDPFMDSFFNVNTREDLELAEKRIRGNKSRFQP
ncbi:MAG: molybdenum cofactor guanylyltransferase [Deltaproteobacteria bacterium]|nr:molybdenum cofactor guanylyltransferase [Deltaproteobacteria bacterium]